MNLRTIDLNLLVVLHQLLQERHVSRAAEQLHMSQPAVSRALQRLRKSLNDDLLVRTSKGYDLTARACVLLPELNDLLDRVESIFITPAFHPSTSEQTIKFYGPDPEVNWFLPPLFERLRKRAPKMNLEVRSDPHDHFTLLESGEVHFVFSPLIPSALTLQLHCLKLAELDFKVIMSANNPLADVELTPEKLINATYGVISLTGKGPSFAEQLLRSSGALVPGVGLRTALRLGSFTSVAKFCEKSDLLFHLPKSFAEEIAQDKKLVVRDILPGGRVEFESVYLYWHKRHHRDPMCIWIRDQIKSLL